MLTRNDCHLGQRENARSFPCLSLDREAENSLSAGTMSKHEREVDPKCKTQRSEGSGKTKRLGL